MNVNVDMHPDSYLTAEKAILIEKRDLVKIYDDFSPRLYKYAARLLNDGDLAEECVAEVFSRLLKSIQRGGGPRENLRAYLYRSAHNWIIDYFRSSRGMVELDLDIQAEPRQSPPALVDERLEQERVRNALLELDPEHRQIILLKYFENWSHEEIAGYLGKSVEASRALLHRALASLKKILVGKE
jgi:RNA polymerase sigma-70 factor, ECF subfamily